MQYGYEVVSMQKDDKHTGDEHAVGYRGDEHEFSRVMSMQYGYEVMSMQ